MKTAYVTTLRNGDAYLPGVEPLGQSLEANRTRVPRVVMVTRCCIVRGGARRAPPVGGDGVSDGVEGAGT